MDAEQFRLHFAMEDVHWWFGARREILGALLRELVSDSRDTRLVEVGCGTGGTLRYFSTAYTCVGIDPSCAAIALAKSRATGDELICSDKQAVVESECGEADVVLMLDVLEHVDDDLKMLGRVVGALRPGGLLIITVPAGAALWSSHDVVLGHRRRYGSHDFAALWSKLPVECLLLTHFNARLYPVVRLIRGLSRRIGWSFGMRGTNLFRSPGFINRCLRSIFAGEAKHLCRALRTGGREMAYPCGVSLIAVLRRTE